MPRRKRRERPEGYATKKRKKKPVVGYRKPPREHRFKPGKSGNPRGRPRKEKSALKIEFGGFLIAIPITISKVR